MQIPPITPPSGPLQATDVPNPPIPTADDIALSIINQNVKLAESILYERAIPAIWRSYDQLYSFYVPQQAWTGSKTPRASLGVPLVLEHTNALQAQVMDILWEEDPPFYPVPYYNTELNESRANAAIINWELGQADAEVEMGAGVHCSILYGTGVWKAYWVKKDGDWLPRLEYIEREHVLVDPSLRHPDIRRAKWVAHVTYMSPEQLDALRGDPTYKLPPLDELKSYGAEPREVAPRISTETNTQFQLPEFQRPIRDRVTSVNPLHHPLKVIEYMDRDFIYTVLSDKRIIRKVDNRKHDKVEYYSAYFVRVKGQFDGLGIAALIGNEQQLQQGIINSMLDNISLSMHGMFKRRRGSTLFPQNIRVQPGIVVDVDELNDFDAVQLPSIKPEVFNVVDDSDRRAARRTGANEVTVQGNLPDTSGGIGRTAAGMNVMAQAAGTRIRSFVKVIEQQVFIPFLEFLQRTNAKYLSAAYVQELLDNELAAAYYEQDTDEQQQPPAVSPLDPQKVLDAKLKFKMLAATKMKRRSAYLSAVPGLISFYQQDAVQSALKDQFKKVNMVEINRMWLDATGWPEFKSLIQDMTPDEQAKLASENPLIQNLIQQKAQTQVQTDAKIQTIDAENSGRAFRDLLKGSIDNAKTQQQLQQALQMLAGALAANRAINDQMPPGQPATPAVPPTQPLWPPTKPQGVS